VLSEVDADFLFFFTRQTHRRHLVCGNHPHMACPECGAYGRESPNFFAKFRFEVVRHKKIIVFGEFLVNRRIHGMSLQLIIRPCPTGCGSLVCQSSQSVSHAAPRDEFQCRFKHRRPSR
jgi:hypothetical protein